MGSISRILSTLALVGNTILLAATAGAQDQFLDNQQYRTGDATAYRYEPNQLRPYVQEEQEAVDPRDTNLYGQQAIDDETISNEEDALEFLKRWPDKPIADIGVFVRDPADIYPEDRSGDLRKNANPPPNYFVDGTFYWVAPNIYYRKLYFEDFRLERYGQTTCGPIVQPVVSSVHFFASLGLWPIRGVIPCKPTCDHPLGYLRPGLPCGCAGPQCNCGQ